MTTKVWDLQTGNEIQTYNLTKSVTSLSITNCNEFQLAATNKNQVLINFLDDSQTNFLKNSDIIKISPDGKQLLQVNSNGIISLINNNLKNKESLNEKTLLNSLQFLNQNKSMNSTSNPYSGIIKSFHNKGELVRLISVEWNSMFLIVIYQDKSLKIQDIIHDDQIEQDNIIDIDLGNFFNMNQIPKSDYITSISSIQPKLHDRIQLYIALATDKGQVYIQSVIQELDEDYKKIKQVAKLKMMNNSKYINNYIVGMDMSKNYLVFADINGNVNIQDVDTMEQILNFRDDKFIQISNQTTSILISKDERYIIIGSNSNVVLMYDIKNGQKLKEYGHQKDSFITDIVLDECSPRIII